MKLRNVLYGISYFGASLSFATIAYWEYLIMTQGQLVLMRDAFSWFDFASAVFATVLFNLLALSSFRSLFGWYVHILKEGDTKKDGNKTISTGQKDA